MTGILSAPAGWEEAVARALASATRPIAFDPRFAPRAADGTSERARSLVAEGAAARSAATLLLLYPADDGRGLVTPLTVRHAGLRSHAGEVSLPGGAVDADDADMAATALREAAEEVGLDADANGVRIAGTLDPIWIPVSSFEVLPVVATCGAAPQLTPQAEEVSGIVELPLARLFEHGAIREELFEVRQWRLWAAAYRHADLRIWGATARSLAMLAAVLGEAGLA